MAGSVSNVVELIGTSAESWEQDVLIEDGEICLFRTKIRLSFKHTVTED
ncbi:MAG: hypothetical protein AAFZ07_08250 [Actinomycetota bacterium]